VQVLRGPAGASITNLAFGGPQRRTVFVTDSTHGHVLTAQMDVAGLPLARR
jgi:gluconolactonase